MDYNIKALIPELVFTLVSMFMLLLGASTKKRRNKLFGGIALATLVANFHLLLWLSRQGTPIEVLGSGMPGGANYEPGIFAVDGYALFFKAIFTLLGILLVLLSVYYLNIKKLQTGEFYSVLLLALLGVMAVVSSVDLTTMFVVFVLISISTYMLIGIARLDVNSNEASLKYFVLNLFATAILLLGISWLYGITGSTKFSIISQKLVGRSGVLSNSFIPTLMLSLLLAGFAFKLTAVPFHSYAVDVYQGALPPVTGFIAAVSKVAAFAILIRLLFSGLNAELLSGKVTGLLWALGIFSLIGGSVTIWFQTNIRRLFAAAGIIQAGYILIGLGIARATSGEVVGESVAKVMFYLVAYAFAIIGIFAALSACRSDGTHPEHIEELRGLIRRSPALTIGITLLVASLAGIPVTAGFMGKLYILKMALGNGFYWLAVLGLIAIHAEAIIYIRLLKVLYSRLPARGTQTGPKESSESLASPRTVIFACVIILLAVGVLPKMLLNWATLAVGSLF
jgi:NADH-quinone oxidoreductase subunit N